MMNDPILKSIASKCIKKETEFFLHSLPAFFCLVKIAGPMPNRIERSNYLILRQLFKSTLQGR